MKHIKNATRCAKIIEMLEALPRTTESLLEDISEEFGKPVSLRTLQRDFREIDAYLGISIEYNRGKKYYEITEYNQDETCKRRLDLIRTDYVFSRVDADNSLVHLDQRVSHRSNDNLGRVFNVLKNREELVFDYHSYWREPEIDRRGLPIFLKEFDGRWYVYVIDTSEKKQGQHRRFPLDRMKSIRGEKYTDSFPKLDHDTIYKNLYGIIVPDEASEPLSVVLKVEKFQANYLIDIPLHTSQKIKSQSDTHIIFSLKLIPTVEFDQKILSLGTSIEVVAPIQYRQCIKQQIDNMATIYEK